MSETIERRHGLEPFFAAVESTAQAGVDISVLSGCGFLNVRLDPRCEQAVEAATRVLGQPMPLAANTFTTGEHRVYWLGPDEWLILTSAEGAAGLGSGLAEALSGLHAAINDVSGGNVALCVSGVDARTVLAKGCTVDLHPREFGPRQCARTGLAKATVLLGVSNDASTCTIVVSRSFADYLCRWLAHAARPHGVRFSMRSAIP
ncbi:sarcosine oxidase subunit gamma [Candidatus Rariloculus sp.]|uniref:sarcosine oxidase subunit gamma n=1 Tax=Candidatus Rariloculus sp. TaxID=3101265 RepID=UPI003D0CB36E